MIRIVTDRLMLYKVKLKTGATDAPVVPRTVGPRQYLEGPRPNHVRGELVAERTHVLLKQLKVVCAR